MLSRKEQEKLKFEYTSARKMMNAHLHICIKNFEKLNHSKPVEHYADRLKENTSVREKLKLKNLVLNRENIENLHDIVGARLICPFIDDVYDMVELINKSDLLRIYEIKNYIENPKKSGYQGIHVLVGIPIRMGKSLKYVKGEIQVRTVAMDAWAAVEHRLKYKPKGNGKLDKEEKEMLITCSQAFKGLEQYLTGFLPKEKEIKQEKIKLVDFDSDRLRNMNELNQKALEQLKTYLNVAIDYYHLKNGENKIEHFDYRLKPLDSALRKLKEKECELTMDSLENNVRDHVGIRLVCPFIDDVYDVVDLIKSSDFLEVYEEKDYIKNPKESGYQSVHLLVNVPVIDGEDKKLVKAEIQVRTLTMDAWAALEDRIKYLEQNNTLTAKQKQELKTCAVEFREIDEYMNTLNKHTNKKDNPEDGLKVLKKKDIK